jgi:lipopolysaccharide export system permease protein
MTLHLYVARRFLGMVGRVFLVFFGLMLLIDTVEQLRRFSGRGAGIGDALRLALANVPESLYRALPLVVVLASVALFLAFARSSELVAMRAAGRSGLRFLAAPVVAALGVGALMVAVLNPLVAATTRSYERLSAEFGGNGGSTLSVADTGLWLRQGGAEGQTVIQARRTTPDGTGLFDVTFLSFGPGGEPLRRVEATSARLEPGAWVLTGAKTWDLGQTNPELGARTAAEGERVPTDLTPARILDSFGTPATVPVWDLPQFIADLERAGFSATAYRLWLQSELALPLLLAGMVLIAAGFTMRHSRLGRTGPLVLAAVLAGFALFFLRNFAQSLGENGIIPVPLAAWSPPVIAILLPLGLLLHVEEG